MLIYMVGNLNLTFTDSLSIIMKKYSRLTLKLKETFTSLLIVIIINHKYDMVVN